MLFAVCYGIGVIQLKPGLIDHLGAQNGGLDDLDSVVRVTGFHIPRETKLRVPMP